MVNSTSAKPFLKWVGGKQQLLSQFESYFPLHFQNYIEPFVGGGAVFFHLWNAGKLCHHITLLDNNDELINAYRIVRDAVDELIEILAVHRDNHCKNYYYHIRNLDRQYNSLDKVTRAARTIYLNKTCYNGLYRVNGKGQFNVPMGSYTAPQVLHEGVLRAASAALQAAHIELKDFREVVDLAQPGDFVYFDPPYDPVSKTASFTGYTSGAFREDDQRALADIFRQLDRKGCLCMLSNSYTPLILDLYNKFRVEVVQAKRLVNSNIHSRGNVSEVVVLNY